MNDSTADATAQTSANPGRGESLSTEGMLCIIMYGTRSKCSISPDQNVWKCTESKKPRGASEDREGWGRGGDGG